MEKVGWTSAACVDADGQLWRSDIRSITLNYVSACIASIWTGVFTTFVFTNVLLPHQVTSATPFQSGLELNALLCRLKMIIWPKKQFRMQLEHFCYVPQRILAMTSHHIFKNLCFCYRNIYLAFHWNNRLYYIWFKYKKNQFSTQCSFFCFACFIIYYN